MEKEMQFDEILKKHHTDDAGFCRHYLLLYSMILGMETKSVFEFGCGFSSKVILKALKETGGKLITCDTRPIEGTGNSSEDIEKHKHNWRYIQGDSLSIVKGLKDETFDFVLHDGSHEYKTVEEDIKNILPRCKKNSILLVHDTEHPTDDYKLKKAVKNALRQCKHSKITLPYGYGLTIVRIEQDFGNGEIEIEWRKGEIT